MKRRGREVEVKLRQNTFWERRKFDGNMFWSGLLYTYLLVRGSHSCSLEKWQLFPAYPVCFLSEAWHDWCVFQENSLPCPSFLSVESSYLSVLSSSPSQVRKVVGFYSPSNSAAPVFKCTCSCAVNYRAMKWQFCAFTCPLLHHGAPVAS